MTRTATFASDARRRIGCMAAAVAASLAMIAATLPAMPAQAAAPNANLNVSLGSGATGVTVETLHQQDAPREALAGVIKWRQDALNDTSVKWQGVTMREYLSRAGISESTYLNPQWSNALERIAIQRAIEANDPSDGHTRLNGESCFTASYNGIGSNAEILAWGSRSFSGAIDQWAGEKADWVNNTGGVTGHYTTLINPGYVSYGFAGASSINWRTTYSGEAKPSSTGDTSPTNLQGDYAITVNLSNSKLDQGIDASVPATVQVGQQFNANPVVARAYNSRFTLQGSWRSSNPNVLSATSDGTFVAKREGTANATFEMTNGRTTTYTVSVQQQQRNGWENYGDINARRWYDNGVMARSKEFYDPGTDAWYWADADGSIAHDKDVYQPSNGGKWVRYDHEGHMIKGEDYRYGGWYWFDPVTGAMAKGMVYVPSNGGKWVYYDWITGQMAHGEQYVDYDADHTGWYYFDDVTGAMYHGDRYIPNGDKWVRYDRVTGQMVKGLQQQDGDWYYFDPTTGAMAKGDTWVPEWNSWDYFDPITGRYVAQIVWWVNNPDSGSRTYHVRPDCPSLRRATHEIVKGWLQDAINAGHDSICSICPHMW